MTVGKLKQLQRQRVAIAVSLNDVPAPIWDVTAYEIDAETGKLDVIGWESTRGEWPRGMNIDPSGTFLYAANQNTDTMPSFVSRIQTASSN